MNQAGKWERFCRDVYQRVDLATEARHARQTCRRQIKRLDSDFSDHDEDYRRIILPFWARYGIKPKKMWFDLYAYKDGMYDPRYVPEEVYWQSIYPALNRPSLRHAYTDKCFYDRLFPYLKQPRTILSNSNNCYYNKKGQIIDKEEAKRLLNNESRFVLKPAIYSGEGIDIYFYDRSQEPFLNWDELLAKYKSDFIVQEIAEQHATLAAIHPDSLNTIRIISFLFRGEVHISSSILRMGVGGSKLDNVSAGGIACPIASDGRLAAAAMNRQSDWMTRHPGGTVFSDVQIPNYDRVLDQVRRAHLSVPHFRIIGWDFAIDAIGDPLFIEYNGAPGMNQVSCGPIFGDLTEAVLGTIFLGHDEFGQIGLTAVGDSEDSEVAV